MPLPITDRVAGAIGASIFRASLNYYEGASSAPAGGTSMTRIAVVRVLGILTATLQEIWANDDLTSRGWHVRWVGTRFEFLAHDTAATLAARAFVTPPDRALVVIGCSFDGTTARIRVGSTTGSAAGVGGGFSAATRNVAVGVIPSTYASPADMFSVLALQASDGVALTDAQLSSHQDDVIEDMEQGRPLRFFRTEVPGTDYYWDASDIYDGPSQILKSTWTDRISSEALTRNGSPEPHWAAARF